MLLSLQVFSGETSGPSQDQSEEKKEFKKRSNTGVTSKYQDFLRVTSQLNRIFGKLILICATKVSLS